MTCNFPGCTVIAEGNGYCFHHARFSNSVAVKPKKEVNKRSEKMKDIMKIAKEEYPKFLAKHPKCMAHFSKQCQKKSSVIHHLKGRTPAVILNQKYWMAVCPICNNEIETRHADAEKLGLKLPRHHKQTI